MADTPLVIVGSGLHGITIYINLPKHIQEKTLIIDPHSSPLSNFYRQVQNVGMQYLRSPASHCLKEPLTSLLSYSLKKKYTNKKYFHGRYYNPSVALFKEYLQYLLDKTTIDTHYIRSTVKTMIFTSQQLWMLKTDTGTISCKNCILALGMGSLKFPHNIQLRSEDDFYSEKELRNMLKEKHVLSHQYVNPLKKKNKDIRMAIIGGGMSGTQAALKYCKQLNKSRFPVTLISGKHTAVHFFDSDPGYIGPKYRNSFLQEVDYDKRKNILNYARNKGSINPYTYEELCTAKKKGEIEYIKEYCVAIKQSKPSTEKNTTYTISLSNNEQKEFDDIIFATGFVNNEVPHKQLIQNIANTHTCKTNSKMWPITDTCLMWHRGLYLIGALAELEIGPAARSIIGAHLACRTLRHVWKQWEC